MVTKESSEGPLLSTASQLLTGIAAAASLNCRTCLETLVPKALEQGVLPEEILEVFSIVSGVRERAVLPPGDLAALLGPEAPTGTKACCDPGGK